MSQLPDMPKNSKNNTQHKPATSVPKMDDSCRDHEWTMTTDEPLGTQHPHQPENARDPLEDVPHTLITCTYNNPQRGKLGFVLTRQRNPQRFVVVKCVKPNSKAEALGIQRGDIVVSANEVNLSKMRSAKEAIEAIYGVIEFIDESEGVYDDQLTMTFARKCGNEKNQMTESDDVKQGNDQHDERPLQMAKQEIEDVRDPLEYVPHTLITCTYDNPQRGRLGFVLTCSRRAVLETYRDFVVVKRVEPNSKAEALGIQRGDIVVSANEVSLLTMRSAKRAAGEALYDIHHVIKLLGENDQLTMTFARKQDNDANVLDDPYSSVPIFEVSKAAEQDRVLAGESAAEAVSAEAASQLKASAPDTVRTKAVQQQMKHSRTEVLWCRLSSEQIEKLGDADFRRKLDQDVKQFGGTARLIWSQQTPTILGLLIPADVSERRAIRVLERQFQGIVLTADEVAKIWQNVADNGNDDDDEDDAELDDELELHQSMMDALRHGVQFLKYSNESRSQGVYSVQSSNTEHTYTSRSGGRDMYFVGIQNGRLFLKDSVSRRSRAFSLSRITTIYPSGQVPSSVPADCFFTLRVSGAEMIHLSTLSLKAIEVRKFVAYLKGLKQHIADSTR